MFLIFKIQIQCLMLPYGRSTPACVLSKELNSISVTLRRIPDITNADFRHEVETVVKGLGLDASLDA